MASVTKYAGAGANVTGVGSRSWNNPGNILAADNTRSATATLGTGIGQSQYLRASSFGFMLPGPAVVTGIAVLFERRGGSGGAATITDARIRLVNESGTILATEDKANIGPYWNTVNDRVDTYGGDGDLWGQSAGFWTPAKVNDSDFGVVLAAQNPEATTIPAQVDSVRITIYYTGGDMTVIRLPSPTARSVRARIQVIGTS